MLIRLLILLQVFLFVFPIIGHFPKQEKLHIQYPKKLSKEIAAFEEEASKRNARLPSKEVVFKFIHVDKRIEDDQGYTVGWCYFTYFPLRAHISIIESEYDDLSTTKREILVFHELGHCLYDYHHKNDATNIMFPTLINSSYYILNKDAILDKYFKGN